MCLRIGKVFWNTLGQLSSFQVCRTACRGAGMLYAAVHSVHTDGCGITVAHTPSVKPTIPELAVAVGFSEPEKRLRRQKDKELIASEMTGKQSYKPEAVSGDTAEFGTSMLAGHGRWHGNKSSTELDAFAKEVVSGTWSLFKWELAWIFVFFV